MYRNSIPVKRRNELISCYFSDSLCFCFLVEASELQQNKIAFYNLRPTTTREWVHLVTIYGHFQPRDKHGGHTIRSAAPENPMLHANFMALCSIEPELLPIEVLHCGNVWLTCDLDLDRQILWHTDTDRQTDRQLRQTLHGRNYEGATTPLYRCSTTNRCMITISNKPTGRLLWHVIGTSLLVATFILRLFNNHIHHRFIGHTT